MGKDLRLEFYMDNTYRVLYNGSDDVAFQGNLSDCPAYIILFDKGYI